MLRNCESWEENNEEISFSASLEFLSNNSKEKIQNKTKNNFFK